jgi:hypothetical protein
MRNDPNPVLEQLIAPATRQTNPQRVIELATQSAPVLCSVYASAGTTLAAGVATEIPFANETTDTAGLHDNAVNNPRITIATAGIYRVYGRIALDVSPGGTYTQVELRVLVSGVEVADEFSGVLTSNKSLMIQHEQFMAVGQYFHLQALMTGVDPALIVTGGIDSTYFIVQKIG